MSRNCENSWPSNSNNSIS